MSTMTTTKPINEARALLPIDRCDQCGARAYMLASKEGVASELLFCLHHGKKQEPSLASKGWNISDQSASIS